MNGAYVTSTVDLNSKHVQVYPNPMTDHIQIKSDLLVKKVVMYQIDGSIVKTALVNSKSVNVSTTGLNPGIYFLNNQFEDGSSALQKIIKL